MQSALDSLFRDTFGESPTSRTPLAQDGSRRRMIRLVDEHGHRAVGVIGPDRHENRAFLSFSRTFREIGLPVPEVFAAEEARGVYLVEDLGDTTLFDALTGAREPGAMAFPEVVVPVYRRVLEWLPRFQVQGGRAVDYGVAYPRARYDAQAMQWDCNYFKYDFLKLAHVPFHEARLEEDFATLLGWLGQAPADHFVYRDLQSRNVMVRDDEPWFIDYQGGLQGPLQYDVAKLLYEGKARLTPELRSELLDHYLEALGTQVATDRTAFLTYFRGFVVLRLLQGLGAYGLLGLYERKPQFMARIPFAIRELEALMDDGFLPIALPALCEVFERLIADDVLRAESPPPTDRLTVRVGSFSYKRGIPEDPSGHGGGFVFDCRALPNPGRLAEYAGRSGLERGVGLWLASHEEVEAFFEQARALVDRQVAVYRERGFVSLHVAFGCTGGQHRSVYLAERLAAFLREQAPDAVAEVTHHEGIHWPATAQRAAAGA